MGKSGEEEGDRKQRTKCIMHDSKMTRTEKP
jgi:hypothetical protein